MNRERNLNLPNALSAGRIIAVPLLIAAAYVPGEIGGVTAAVIFSLAAITDLLDGYLARRLGRVTTLGKFLDPVADKLVVTSALVLLVMLDRAPAWLVILIISREIMVTGLRAAAAASQQRIVISAGMWGKIKTVCQIVAVIGLLVDKPLFGLPFKEVGYISLYIALVLTLFSGWLYFKEYWAVITTREGDHNVDI